MALDLARGILAAHPGRRSALLALVDAVRLLARRPLAVAGMGLVGTLAALGTAAALLLLRAQIRQGSPAGIAAAFVLAQLAVAAVGWGRAARIAGFAELVRADAAERAVVAPAPAPAMPIAS